MITINYKSGETRIINPTADFYRLDSKLEKGVTVEEKVKALIASFGGLVFTAQCYLNGKLFYNRSIEANSPESNDMKFVENYCEQRRLRNKHKRDKFTQKWNFTTGVFTNLVNGKQSESLQIAA